MYKEELITAMAEKTGFMKKDAEKSLNAILETIEETLGKGESIQLVGFGSFSVKERKAREGRNPKNPKEVIRVDACKAPVWKPGTPLKQAVNRK